MIAYLLRQPYVPFFGLVAVVAGFAGAFVGCWAMAVLREHSARSRQQMQAVRLAISRLGWKDQTVAEMLGITTARLSRAWAGIEALNLWRLAELPEEFQLEWVRAQSALLGARVLGPEELALIYAFSEMPHAQRHEMLKVQSSQRQEGAA